MSPRASARTGARAGARGGERRAPRGRAMVFLGLLVFLLAATAAIWRRAYGIARARELSVLDARRVQLEGERAALESAVRMAASRGRIGATAEQRLGMRIPSDTQVVILTRTDRRAPSGGAGSAGDSTP